MRTLSASLVFSLLLLLLVFAVGGCSTTEDSQNASVRPWNAPQGWENGLPSTMTEGH